MLNSGNLQSGLRFPEQQDNCDNDNINGSSKINLNKNVGMVDV